MAIKTVNAELMSAVACARRELDAIDGAFGQLVYNPNEDQVSNDLGWREYALKELTDISATKKLGGIAVSIGAGNMFSLLPIIKPDLPVVIDFNAALTGGNRCLQDIIMGCNNAFTAVPRFTDYELGRVGPNPIHDNYISTQHSTYVASLRTRLGNERRWFGPAHWKNFVTYPSVMKHVKSTPVSFVNANIQNDRFVQAFNGLVDYIGLEVNFANFTNIHEWIDPVKVIETLGRLAISDDAIIVTSDHIKVDKKVSSTRNLPKIKVFANPSEYFEYLRVNSDDFTKLSAGYRDIEKFTIPEKPWQSTLNN